MRFWSKRRGGHRPNLRARPSRRPGQSPARRGWAAKAKRIGLAGLGIVAVGLAVWGATEAYRAAKPVVNDWLEVREVTVSGTNQVTRQEVLDRLALPPGETLLSVRPSELADRLLSHPWIKDASVHRVVPHTLAVTIAERLPAAVLKTSSVPLLLDSEGHVLTALTEAGEPELPLLTGIDYQGLVLGKPQPRQAAQAGIRLAGLLGNQFQGRAEVDMGNPDNAVVYIQGLRFQFGSSSFEEQWERYQKVEHALSVDANGGQGELRNEIDLRYPGKVIVRERG